MDSALQRGQQAHVIFGKPRVGTLSYEGRRTPIDSIDDEGAPQLIPPPVD